MLFQLLAVCVHEYATSTGYVYFLIWFPWQPLSLSPTENGHVCTWKLQGYIFAPHLLPPLGHITPPPPQNPHPHPTHTHPSPNQPTPKLSIHTAVHVPPVSLYATQNSFFLLLLFKRKSVTQCSHNPRPPPPPAKIIPGCGYGDIARARNSLWD